ncbi:MAG: hypothetical protein JO094_07910 [Hyphomicrobiales bacterium]|nr:hypothetical protein [Hyphomicrobiales bacterium]MBV9050937.1 hypothetical protein [Hyphomicrobiales bacterium]MBV9975659.1 hypothetical protein [Hyphomicrobiales bacterium]
MLKRLGGLGSGLYDLASFQNDWIRLAAFCVLAFAIVAAIAAGPVAKAWVEDRKDRRKYELKQQELLRKIAEKNTKLKGNESDD